MFSPLPAEGGVSSLCFALLQRLLPTRLVAPHGTCEGQSVCLAEVLADRLAAAAGCRVHARPMIDCAAQLCGLCWYSGLKFPQAPHCMLLLLQCCMMHMC